MKISTKFNHKQKVYFPYEYTKHLKRQCKYCKGNKMVTIVETMEQMRCPECHGRGYHESRKLAYKVKSGEIVEVFVTIHYDKSQYTRYVLRTGKSLADRDLTHVNEGEIYKTEAQARKAGEAAVKAYEKERER